MPASHIRVLHFAEQFVIRNYCFFNKANIYIIYHRLLITIGVCNMDECSFRIDLNPLCKGKEDLLISDNQASFHSLEMTMMSANSHFCLQSMMHFLQYSQMSNITSIKFLVEFLCNGVLDH